MEQFYLRCDGTKTVPSSLRSWDDSKSNEHQQSKQCFGTLLLYQFIIPISTWLRKCLLGEISRQHSGHLERSASNIQHGEQERAMKQIILIFKLYSLCLIFATVLCRVKLRIPFSVLYFNNEQEQMVNFMIFADMKELLFGNWISVNKWNLIK